MRAELAISRHVAAPVEAVWDYLVTWELQGEWIPLTKVRKVDDHPAGQGEKILARTGIGPLGFDDTMTVVTWEPPTRCEVLHTGDVVKGSGDFRLSPAGTGTRFTWAEVVEVPGGPVAPVLWLLAKPALTLAYRFSLRTLARRVEARHGRG